MNLFLSFRRKTVIPATVTTLGLVAIANVALVNRVQAFSITNFNNAGFEDTNSGGNSVNGWSTIGDVTTIGSGVVTSEQTIINNVVQSSISNIDPIAGNGQAIITNAYNNLNGADRIDDVDDNMGPANIVNFNQSDINPVDADTDPGNNDGEQDLQGFLGLNQNELSIAREPVIEGDVRTSKEGSGLSQTFTINISETDFNSGNNAFEISFNWAYLTNDGLDADMGNQDYSFFSLYEQGATDPGITLLGDSDRAIANPDTANEYNYGDTTYYQDGSVYTTQVTGLDAGEYTYVLGFGVVDIDGSGRSSALVLDNLGIKQVPFEFTPTTGIAIVLSFIGFNKLRCRLKK